MKEIVPRPLNQLVAQYGHLLAPALVERVKPLYNFEEEQVLSEEERKRLDGLGQNMPLQLWTPEGSMEWRGPLPGQRHAIAAIVHGFTHGVNRIIERGETGVGKTQITLMALDLLDFRGKDVFPALVVTPSRLTRQWQVRARMILPDVKTWVIKSLEDVDAFAQMVRLYRKRNQKILGILSMSMISRGPGYHPVGRLIGVKPDMHGKIDDNSPFFSPTMVKDGSRGHIMAACPDCYRPLIDVHVPTEGDRYIHNLTMLEKYLRLGPLFCPRCGAPLFEETRELTMGKTIEDRSLLYDVGAYINHQWKRLAQEAEGPLYRTLITDEMHKMMGDTSIRGSTWRRLMHRAHYALGLTATPYGGTAHSMRMIYHAFYPTTWEKWGGFTSTRWVEELGNVLLNTKVKIDPNAPAPTASQLRNARRGQKKELPSANLRLATMLMERMIHIKLQHLGIKMPPYEISGVSVTLDPEHQAEYDKMFRSTSRQRMGWVRGGYAQNCLTYALAPWMKRNAEFFQGIKVFPESYICAPERATIQLCKEEKAAGRKVIIYVTHSDLRDLPKRLIAILGDAGISAARLPSSMDREDIPEWLDKEACKYDVIVLNQKAVEGVDALHFQTVFFYEVDYSLYPVPQAAGRCWRLGQTKPCKTVFLEVPKTLLYRALEISMQKIGAASVLYGDDLDAMSARFTTGSVLNEALKAELDDTPLMDLNDLYAKAAQAITSGMAGGQP